MAGPKPAALPLGYAPSILSLPNIAMTQGLVSSTLQSDLGRILEIQLEISAESFIKGYS